MFSYFVFCNTFEQTVYKICNGILSHDHFLLRYVWALIKCFSTINIFISEHTEVTICCKIQRMSLWKTIFQGLLLQFPTHWQYPLQDHLQWVFLVAIVVDFFLTFIFLKFLCVYICSFGTVTITIYLILTSKVFCCWCWHFQWLNWFMLGFDFSVWLLWSFVSSLHNPSSLHLDCGMALWVCSSSNIHASKINAYESIVFSLGYQVFQFRYLLLSSS